MTKSVALPRGFYYWADFISAREEVELLNAIKKLKFENPIVPGYVAERQVIQYGFEYSFASGRFTPTSGVPEYLARLQDKMSEKIGRVQERLGKPCIVITKYPAGSGITWHRDEGPFEEISAISLSGGCTLRLRNRVDKRKVVSISLQPRSAYILAGPARWDWEHRIAPTKHLRYSIIFRMLDDKGLSALYPGPRPKQ